MKMRAYAGVAALVLTVLSPAGASANSVVAPECGEPISKSNGTAWRCTFADYFDGTTLDTRHWSALRSQDTSLGIPECFVDSPNNISVRDGSLYMTIRKEPRPFFCPLQVGGFVTQYTAGGVTSWAKFNQAYGRYETRAAFPATKEPGVYGAIWMWPQSNKGKYGDKSGEIDTAEFWTAEPNVVRPFVHYDDGGTDPDKTAACPVSRPEDFHTYALEWTEHTLTFIYDGQVCLVDDWNPAAPLQAPQPFDEPFFLTMNIDFGGYLPHDLKAPLPQTMKVDYVKVWS